MYGPITTLRRNNHVVKHIPWSAFKMVDQDWTRVVDARDILGVSRFVFAACPRTNLHIRILIGSSNISPPRSNPLSGVPFPHLKSCKQHGRRSATVQDMHCTRTLSMMASQRLASTTRVWMKSPASSLHSVIHFSLNLMAKIYTNNNPLKYFIRTISSPTSNLHGVVLRNKV